MSRSNNNKYLKNKEIIPRTNGSTQKVHERNNKIYTNQELELKKNQT